MNSLRRFNVLYAADQLTEVSLVSRFRSNITDLICVNPCYLVVACSQSTFYLSVMFELRPSDYQCGSIVFIFFPGGQHGCRNARTCKRT